MHTRPINNSPLQSYSMDCYFRQTWIDRRLAFSGQKNLALSIEMLRKIWKPDTYIFNGRRSYLHTITTPNKFMRLFPNGRVLYSQRYSGILQQKRKKLAGPFLAWFLLGTANLVCKFHFLPAG